MHKTWNFYSTSHSVNGKNKEFILWRQDETYAQTITATVILMIMTFKVLLLRRKEQFYRLWIFVGSIKKCDKDHQTKLSTLPEHSSNLTFYSNFRENKHLKWIMVGKYFWMNKVLNNKWYSLDLKTNTTINCTCLTLDLTNASKK